ncbi:MAG TPA: hypothetical protein VM571_04555 [Noviherbaspirillum sp.]|nr:hypothetical protein [Noviherbaspirillum sp.]
MPVERWKGNSLVLTALAEKIGQEPSVVREMELLLFEVPRIQRTLS